MMGIRNRRVLARVVFRSIVVATLLAFGVGNLPAEASPVKITAKDHEGQRKVDGVLSDYTSGNIVTYAERDTINFRFDLQATHGPSSGDLEVRFTGDDGTCLFFDPYFVLGAIENLGGGPVPTVTVASGPTAQDFGTSSGEWVVTLHIVYPQTFDHATNEVQVNYQLRLSDEAGACSGSSQHSRLNPAGGVVEQTGAQNVPVPANQVIELGQLTVQKIVDSGSATPDQWCFTISPDPQSESPKCPAPGEDTVIFTGLPTGNYTVTESNVPGYSFASGEGTNCTFQGAVGTAEIVAAPDPTDATCIFHNAIVPGSVTVNKSEAGGTPTRTFTFTLSGPNGFSDTQTTTLGAGGSTLVWNDLEPGTYQLCETVPAGYESSLGPTDPSGQACGPTFEVDASEDLEFNVNNIPCPDGSLVISRQIPSGTGPATFTYTIDRPAPFADQTVQLIFGTNDTFRSTTVNTPIAGDYTITESGPARFSQNAPIPVSIDPPECEATAGFTGGLEPVNPLVRVIKTEQLSPDSPKRAARGRWAFYLVGPDTDPNTPGIQGETQTKVTNTGGADHRLRFADLAPGDYMLCEKFTGGWRSNLGGQQGFPLPTGDRCVIFNLELNEVAVFRVNNRCPSGGFAVPR